VSVYDLIVIGAGPGGYVAAARAGQLGLKVACVEAGALGGTCLNVGCIPSKVLLESSELYQRASRGLSSHGINLGPVGLDLAAMMARKDRIVRTMTQGIAALFRGRQVDLVQGRGRILGPGRVEVDGADGKQVLETRQILIATGSYPVELKGLPFDGERIIGSTEALSLPAVPGRLVVIGAGAIGLELGSVWRRLGAEVLVVEFMDQILPGIDRELAEQLQRLLKRQGIACELQARARGAVVEDGRVRLTVEAGGQERVEECDQVLVAVGRRPRTEGLGLEKVGIERDERGRIKVHEGYQTTVAGIYAVGDVIAGPMLAHKAEAEGVALVERLAGLAGSVNYRVIPAVVYTRPELATVGLTEEGARAQAGEVKTGRYLFRANARAHAMDEIDGLAKVVVDARTDRLLGVHILGPQASHLIAEAAVAMEFGASAEDLARTIHAHPSLSEVVKEAAWAAQE
jgi:dihydrolipoamide dehydrogenase